MHLICTSAKKDEFGVYEVDVVVKNNTPKKYTFYLQSEYAYRQFLRHLRFKNYGKALNVLKKFNIRR